MTCKLIAEVLKGTESIYWWRSVIISQKMWNVIILNQKIHTLNYSEEQTVVALLSKGVCYNCIRWLNMDSVINAQHSISAETDRGWVQTTRSSNAIITSKGNCSKHQNSKDNVEIQYDNFVLMHWLQRENFQLTLNPHLVCPWSF